MGLPDCHGLIGGVFLYTRTVPFLESARNDYGTYTELPFIAHVQAWR
jgi:hypothetical protein